MRKWLIGIAILVVAASGGWYWGSPWWTLREMRAAAEAKDADRLSAKVDFPTLRQNLKDELAAQMVLGGQSPPSDGLGSLGSALAVALGGRLVDAMVTPSAVRMLFLRNKDGSTGPVAVDASKGNDMSVRHIGFDRFELIDAKRPQAGALIFVRHGLGWQLSGVRLPDPGSVEKAAGGV